MADDDDDFDEDFFATIDKAVEQHQATKAQVINLLNCSGVIFSTLFSSKQSNFNNLAQPYRTF